MGSDHTNSARQTILLVEDDQKSRELVARRLAWAGYRLLLAADGTEALGQVAEQRPDLVLLDIMLPGISGYEVLREVRRHYSPTALPVVMMTGRSSQHDVLRALQAGANDYVTKPFEFAVVLARIELQCKLAAATRELTEGERHYRLLAEHSPDLITVHDRDGVIQFASPASRVIVGFEPEEMVGKRFVDFFHPDDLQTSPDGHPVLPDTDPSILRMRRVDGFSVWVEMVTRAIQDEQTGEVASVQASTREISTRDEAWAAEAPANLDTVTPVPQDPAERQSPAKRRRFGFTSSVHTIPPRKG
jgi:PAS domain S-box-containing protein